MIILKFYLVSSLPKMPTDFIITGDNRWGGGIRRNHIGKKKKKKSLCSQIPLSREVLGYDILIRRTSILPYKKQLAV